MPVGPRLARILATICVALFLVVIAFRALIYSRMYIAPDEPFGISDVIEFLLGCALLAALGMSAVTAAILAVRGPQTNRIWALILVAIASLILLAYDPLHTLAATWSVPRSRPVSQVSQFPMVQPWLSYFRAVRPSQFERRTRAATPNPSIEGMPKRLRLLVTPHVKR
jgi:hypothetical protein